LTLENKNLLKKLLGVLLVILGVISVVTPFTPFGWLIFVGLEFLGIRLAFWEKIKLWFKNIFRNS
jgi:uncharacterized protein YqgC (DUF456 family)